MRTVMSIRVRALPGRIVWPRCGARQLGPSSPKGGPSHGFLAVAGHIRAGDARWSRGAAVPLVEPQLSRGNVHQPRDVGDGLGRNLAAACREPAVHRIQPEQESEPELRRATPPRQLLQLITGQGPVPDQLIIIQHTRHEASGSPASTAATSHRKPNESGSILTAHDQPRPGIRRRSSASPQRALLTWLNAIACTW